MGELSLEARPAGYVPQFYRWKPDTEPTSIPNQLTMRFQKGIAIGGQIQDSSGRPIANATVELSMPATSSSYGGGLYFDLGTLTSDGQGRWRCDVAPGDLSRIHLAAHHPDFTPGGTEPTPALKEQKHVLRLEQGVVIRGRVFTAQGQPVQKVNVSLGRIWANPNDPQAKTEAQGQFVLKNCPLGPSAVTVQGEGFAPQCQELTVRKENAPLSFRLEPGATLRGRVVNPQGKPLDGIGVYADTWQGLRTLTFRTTTDKEGRFVWTSAPRNTVIFHLAGKSYLSDRNRRLAASNDEHVITLYPELLIRGTVVDEETGKPIDKFQYCSGFRRDTEPRPFFSNRFTPGRNGHFEYHDPEASMPNIFVKVVADGYNPAVSRTFKPTDGEQSYEFKLKRGRIWEALCCCPTASRHEMPPSRLLRQVPILSYKMAN